MKWTFYVLAVTTIVAFVCSCQKEGAEALRAQAIISDARNEISEAELESNITALVSFGTRNTFSTQTSKTRGIGAAQAWLESKFGALAQGNDRFKVFTDCLQISGTRVCNVGAILKGTVSPEKYFVVSGHYDSMPTNSKDGSSDAPGADDDASGTAVVLEAARVLSRREVPISVIFLATVGEEQGLRGARHFAALMKQKGCNIVGMITNDIVGSSDGSGGSAPNRLRLFSDWNGKYTWASKALAQKVKASVETATQNQFTIALQNSVDRPGRSGDHIGFLEQGFPAIRFIEPYEDLRHQHKNVSGEYGDLPEYLEYDFMARVVLANVIAILSN